MIRWNRLSTGMAMTAIILSGCGTEHTTELQHSGSTKPPSEMAQGKEKKSQTAQANQVLDASSTHKSKNNSAEPAKHPAIRLFEQKLSYNKNGKVTEETAFLKHAESDAYSLYILPEYELSAEEPNRDILSYKSDGSVFMRIEMLSSDADIKSEKETMKTELAAFNVGAKEINVPNDEFFKNAYAMEASKGGDVVTSYLLPDSGIQLTLYTKQSTDNRDAFLQMAKTIIKEKSKNE